MFIVSTDLESHPASRLTSVCVVGKGTGEAGLCRYAAGQKLT